VPIHVRTNTEMPIHSHTRGRYESAIQDASRAVDLEPRHWRALEVRGTAYRSLKQYEEALESLEAALQLNPWSSELATRIWQTSRSLQIRSAKH